MASSEHPDARPLVSLIAVNHEGAGILERFLAGVARSDYQPRELLIVDNDGSAAPFAGREGVQVIRSPENLGFGRGCNLGARHARGELLLFLNPDVELEADTVSVLVRDLRATEGAAVAFATSLEPGSAHERRHPVEDVASMSGAVVLVEREHFERLGGFDPAIFLYHEDTDLSYRTILAGRRALKVWDAVAWHDVGGAGGGDRWSAEQIRNGVYVHLKTRAWPAALRYLGRMAVKTAVRGVRLRDPAVLGAWTDNARRLPATLAQRRRLRGAATREDRRRLERLGAQHAYWARRDWRERVARSLRARIGGR
jgi:GT2 family glycosyltransferase